MSEPKHPDVILRAPGSADTEQMEVVLVRISDDARVVCLPSWRPEEHTCDGRDFYVILRSPELQGAQ